jgi:NAD(P)-dependent dehydrogenase (short-subunit alcohol dehydrogenase family)
MTDGVNKVALITGSNKGIGLEAARQLGQSGIHVLIGARDAARGEQAARQLSDEGISARAIRIDVTDQGSIDAAAADIAGREGRLDILVNNAGIALERFAPSELEMATLRQTMETNFFGAFAVAKAFMPMLTAAPAGRIVNVSSGLGSLHHLTDPEWIGYPMMYSAYSISKTALNALTAMMAAEFHGTAAKVNSVEPGFTETDLTGGHGFQTAADAARVLVKFATIGPDGPNGGFFELNGRMPW